MRNKLTLIIKTVEMIRGIFKRYGTKVGEAGMSLIKT